MIGLKDSPECYWFIKHPDKGWITAPPCEAGSALIEFDWEIRLGSCPDNDEIRDFDLFTESVYWEAEAKKIQDEWGILKICRLILDRLRRNISEEMEEMAVRVILERQDYERQEQKKVEEILREAI